VELKNLGVFPGALDWRAIFVTSAHFYLDNTDGRVVIQNCECMTAPPSILILGPQLRGCARVSLAALTTNCQWHVVFMAPGPLRGTIALPGDGHVKRVRVNPAMRPAVWPLTNGRRRDCRPAAAFTR
jgi:hypothetical protein